MKKYILIILTICIGVFSTSISYGSNNNNDVKLTLNGTPMSTEISPIIRNNRVLFPIRNIFENLGGSVNWDKVNEKITVNYKNSKIVLTLNKKTILVNDKVVTMDVAPDVVNERAFIPFRAVFENLGISVNWINTSNVATLTMPDYFENLPNKIVLGYTTSNYTGDKVSLNSLKETKIITTIATFSYGIDSKGKLLLTGGSQKDTVDYALKNNMKPLVLIHNIVNGKFNSDIAHSVLSNNKIRKTLINNIVTTIASQQYAGVNIDLESFNFIDRSNYSTFIKELKESLTQYGFLTTISIPAKKQDYVTTNSWGSAFDYKTLGKYADKIELMTYDEHYSAGSPGPIASLPWVDSVLKYATSLIPSQKIILGIAGYGYDWTNNGSSVVTFKNVDNLLNKLNIQPQWSNDASSPFFVYNKDGISHQVWYENINSLSPKIDLVNKYSLGGIALWRLGYDNSSLWNVIDNKL